MILGVGGQALLVLFRYFVCKGRRPSDLVHNRGIGETTADHRPEYRKDTQATGDLDLLFSDSWYLRHQRRLRFRFRFFFGLAKR